MHNETHTDTTAAPANDGQRKGETAYMQCASQPTAGKSACGTAQIEQIARDGETTGAAHG